MSESDDEFTGGGNLFIDQIELDLKKLESPKTKTKKIKGGDPSKQDLDRIKKTDDLNVNECQAGKAADEQGGRCMSDQLGKQLIEKADLSHNEKNGNLTKVIKTAVIKINKEAGCKDTDCFSESLALHNKSDELDEDEKNKNKKDHFAGEGPAGANLSDRKEWLSNGHIDDNIMSSYAKKWNKSGNHYYHMTFHMCGFMKDLPGEAIASDGEKTDQIFPTKLGKLGKFKFKEEVVDKGYKYFGCVLNTATYDTGGQHWVALFVDIPNKTIEYFDSVGHGLDKFPDVCKWVEAVRGQMPELKFAPLNVEPHQKKNWDCGLFACYYIIKRVQGTPYEAFHSSDAPLDDELMSTMRQRFFRLKDF